MLGEIKRSSRVSTLGSVRECGMSMLLKKFFNDESGATAIEYALIAGSIGIAIITVAGQIGTSLVNVFTAVVNGFN